MFEAADIIIYIKGKGIVLKEKSLVAYNTISSKIMAFGEAALTMAENPADNIKVISPLRRGMVADYIAAVKLFTYLLFKHRLDLFALAIFIWCVLANSIHFNTFGSGYMVLQKQIL